jgi:D-alanine--poly(phosphoribitol) ligase subunit 1
MAILDSIQHWANVEPERLAHVSGKDSLTYGELARRSDRLAAHFVQAYADTRRPIAIYGHKEPEMLIGFLGAVKSGHPYVPLDVAIPQHRIDHILDTSQALTLLSAPDIAALTEKDLATPLNPTRAVADNDPFYIMFTSGSTGDPKGVVITCRNLQSFVDWLVHEQQFADQGEIFLDQAPFSFDLSVMDIYPCLVTGNTLFSLHQDEITNPMQLYSTLTRSQVTTWV